MGNFKDYLQQDLNTFINPDEFAELHTVIYDGETYEDIAIVLSDLEENNRHQFRSDYIEGLYLVSAVMHCSVADLGGIVPEKGTKININDGTFFRKFTVASSICELGMLRLDLEAIDE